MIIRPPRAQGWRRHGLCQRDIDKLNRQMERAIERGVDPNTMAASTVTHGPLYSKKYGHRKD